MISGQWCSSDAVTRGRATSKPRGKSGRLTADNPAFYEAWFRLAQSQIEQGEQTAAVESIDCALSLDPLNPAAYPVIGQIVSKLPRAQAEEASERWLALIDAEKAGAGIILINHLPRSSKVYDLAATAEAQPKRPTKSEEDAWEVSIANARALHAAKNWEKACFAWSELLNTKPGNFESNFRLGQALQHLGEMKRALAHFERAYRARPRHVRNVAEYARCLVANNKQDEAEELWRSAIAREDADVALRVGYVSLLAEIGKVDEAKSAAGEAFDLIAEPNRNALLLVRILSDLRGSDVIVNALGRICQRPHIVSLDREQIELIARFAIALDLEGRSHEAEDWLKFADECGPCHRLVVRNLVRILANLNQIDAAQHVIDRMLTRTPQRNGRGSRRLKAPS